MVYRGKKNPKKKKNIRRSRSQNIDPAPLGEKLQHNGKDHDESGDDTETGNGAVDEVEDDGGDDEEEAGGDGDDRVGDFDQGRVGVGCVLLE